MEVTRYAHIRQAVEPLRNTERTRLPGMGRLTPRTLEAIFDESQQAMSRAVLREERRGLYIFAAHRRAGHVAGLWLECTEQPRAGMIGRHDLVDLPLPLDEALSLRHLMFIVRKVRDEVRTTVINLQTTGGLELESSQPVQLVDANGFLAVTASEFAFFCVPTGGGVPWKPDSLDPWGSRTQQEPLRVEGLARAARGATVVSVDLMDQGGPQRASFDEAALNRGILIGRDERCDLCSKQHTLSRVHAVLVNVDGRPFIVDSGSTNGIDREGTEVRIARLEGRQTFSLGQDVMLTCHPR